MQDIHEDEELEMNIQSIGNTGDISLRQIAHLKGGFRRIKAAGQSLLPLQVKTKRSKEEKVNQSQ